MSFILKAVDPCHAQVSILNSLYKRKLSTGVLKKNFIPRHNGILAKVPLIEQNYVVVVIERLALHLALVALVH
jgi:hypothetical protein